MTTTPRNWRFYVLCFGVFAMMGAGSFAQSPSQSSTPVSPAPDAVVRTPAGFDPHFPLKIGMTYYPADSKRKGETGKCVVRIQVNADGEVSVAQVVSSTGFERLDDACLAAFSDVRFHPATLDGKPISSWSIFSISWTLGKPIENRAADFSLVPQIQDNFRFDVGPKYYPEASRAMHQEGDCVVKVYVAENGTLGDMAVSKSTGFATLDQACISAVQNAEV
jgi:TonB family protein